jgi:membrane protein
MRAPGVGGRAAPAGQPRGALGVNVKDVLRGARARMKQHDLPSLAAGVAFKIFLSLFPGIAAAVAIFSLAVEPAVVAQRVAELLTGFPGAVQELVTDQVEGLTVGEGAPGALVLGVVGGIWAASSAAATLIKALNRINAVEESRNVVLQRVVAIALVLGLFAAIAALLALVILGPQVRRLLLPEELLGGAAAPLFGVAQVLGAIAILIVLFAFVYWLGPNRDRPEWRWMSPGAVLGVVGWLVLSFAFAIYAQTAGTYSATYSALAGVVITLVWLQLSMTVLLLGAEVNAEVEVLLEREAAVVEGAGQAPLEPALPEELPARSAGIPPVAARDRRGCRAAVTGGALAAAAGLVAFIRRRR